MSRNNRGEYDAEAIMYKTVNFIASLRPSSQFVETLLAGAVLDDIATLKAQRYLAAQKAAATNA